MPSPSLLPLVPTAQSSVVAARVRFDETDAMGIVHHARYLGFFELARIEWLRARGIRYADWARTGRHLAVIEASCSYLQPARFDDELAIAVTLAELRTASLRFVYTLRRDGTVLAEAGTRHACIDDSGRPRRLDEAMLEGLRRGELG